MKCPLRANALGDFGDCYTNECAWWNAGCIVTQRITDEEPTQLTPNFISNRLFTVNEVADILNIKQDRVYSLVREKILPSVCLGRQIRFSGSALDKFIEEGGKKFPSGWKR